MPGSSASIATPNTILNTVVAEELKGFADKLEKSEDLENDLHNLIRDTIRNHRRIIFNGNGYDESWITEAERRGLSNYASTPEALAHYLDEKNVRVMTENGVLTKTECLSRYEIYLEKYSKTIRVEASTLLDMTMKDILPAVNRYASELKKDLALDRELNMTWEGSYSQSTALKLGELISDIFSDAEKLKKKLAGVPDRSTLDVAFYYHDEIIPLMESIRRNIDEAESLTAREYWPIPTYRELLFGVD